MNPDQPTTPAPNAPEPEANPVPPPAPQPEPSQEPAPSAGPAETQPTAQPLQNNEQIPSAFKLFKPSWEALKLNIVTFLILGIVPFLGFIVSTFGIAGGIAEVTDNASVLLAAVIIVGVISLVFTPAVTFTQVKSVQGQKVGVGEALKASLNRFFAFWGVMILSGLMILGGFLLLVVPGVFMIRRYFLAPYGVFTENLGVWGTMERSKELCKPRAGAVWGVIGVSILISLVGIIPLIGWIISLIGSVMYYCAPALRWEQLRKLGPAPVEA